MPQQYGTNASRNCNPGAKFLSSLRGLTNQVRRNARCPDSLRRSCPAIASHRGHQKAARRHALIHVKLHMYQCPRLPSAVGSRATSYTAHGTLYVARPQQQHHPMSMSENSSQHSRLHTEPTEVTRTTTPHILPAYLRTDQACSSKSFGSPQTQVMIHATTPAWIGWSLGALMTSAKPTTSIYESPHLQGPAQVNFGRRSTRHASAPPTDQLPPQLRSGPVIRCIRLAASTTSARAPLEHALELLH